MSGTKEFIMKPKVDFCFKELMADELVRKGFVSAVLGVPAEEIDRVEMLPTHLKRQYESDKLGILDVRVLLNSSVQIDMEIQVAPFAFWAERSLFYLSRMYTEQIGEGEKYNVLQKCIHVGILGFVLFNEDKEFYSRFHLWEDSRKRVYSDKLEVHILELPKLERYEQPETELLNWARFLNAERKEELEMTAKTNQFIGRAYDRLINLSADKAKRLEYEERQKAIRDYNTQMESNWQDGLKTGEERGLEQGRNQGIEALILDNLEEEKSREEIIAKLMKRFALDSEAAKEYYNRYTR